MKSRAEDREEPKSGGGRRAPGAAEQESEERKSVGNIRAREAEK